MQQKRVPLRKCTGCGEMKPKKELVRIVKDPEGAISLDRTGKKAGRGAYLCPDEACLAVAKKARRLEKAFSCQIPEAVYTQLEEALHTDD